MKDLWEQRDTCEPAHTCEPAPTAPTQVRPSEAVDQEAETGPNNADEAELSQHSSVVLNVLSILDHKAYSQGCWASHDALGVSFHSPLVLPH